MYYILYSVLYVFSLLPFRVLYIISDGLYFFLYYVVKYRKEVVSSNLLIAFPEKTEKERKQIAKQFYKNFGDQIVETIKLISMSNKVFDERCNGDFSAIEKLAIEGKNVQ